MNFELRALPIPTEGEQGYIFVFSGDKLLVGAEIESIYILQTNQLTNHSIEFDDEIYLGRLDGIPCYAGNSTLDEPEMADLKLIGLRQLFGLVEDELFWLAARAYHLVNWSRNTKHCGRCGEKSQWKSGEHAKGCPSCGLAMYPKISPAVIVAITKGDRILLAQNAMNKSGFYSVLAGFVEPGENLEDCVRREIKEEAGIDVQNIKYFGSQPWPFPDSLMLGFTAEYAGGELILDKTELSDAKWFKADELPNIPSKLSISRKLIDWFVENNIQK